MIYTCKPTKVAIYVNTSRKTAAQIKKETGCTAIINGGLYNMYNFKPVCHLKVDGNVLAKDQYKYWGFGWDSGKANLQLVENYSKLDNYICCVCMVRNGRAEQMYYNADVGGSRPRTAIGVFSNGKIWLYADSSNKTPEQLQKIALQAGVKHAVMLDGGGSTQCIFPAGKITSSRIVHNYICVWENETPKQPTTTNTVKCPYSEPILNVRYGSRGNGAKWVQWHLNRNGANLVVDGVFGTKSVTALKAFQSKNGLVADGICGKLSRTALKK